MPPLRLLLSPLSILSLLPAYPLPPLLVLYSLLLPPTLLCSSSFLSLSSFSTNTLTLLFPPLPCTPSSSSTPPPASSLLLLSTPLPLTSYISLLLLPLSSSFHFLPACFSTYLNSSFFLLWFVEFSFFPPSSLSVLFSLPLLLPFSISFVSFSQSFFFHSYFKNHSV